MKRLGIKRKKREKRKREGEGREGEKNSACNAEEVMVTR